jgi:hypothetical protein
MNRKLTIVSKNTTTRKNYRNPSPKADSVAPEPNAPDSTLEVNPDPPDDDEDDRFTNVDWQRVPHLQRRAYEHGRGSKPSWIYIYGWPVWHWKLKKKYWLCSWCHLHKKLGGEFNVELATSSAAKHLGRLVAGHGYNQNGKISTRVSSQPSLLAHMQASGVEVSQQVANEMAGGFSRAQFLRAVTYWIADDNQSLIAIEKPSFRSLIRAANPLAEQYLWKNHQSLRDAVITEYNSFIPAVRAHLKTATSLIHFSFDNWTSTGNKKAICGICVHHLNALGDPEDYTIGLPVLHGKHSGKNIASVVKFTLEIFQIEPYKVGYFVLDNATNNDTAVQALGEALSFNIPYKRLRCTCHILNLAAQTIIWGKDKDGFENEEQNLQVK